MSKLKVTTIADPDNDNTAISIDTSGNITIPNNATFTGTVTGAGGGKVLQVVNKVETTWFNTSSTSYTASGHYIDITPTSTSSKILVMFRVTTRRNTTGNNMFGTIYRDSTELYGGRGLYQRNQQGYDANDVIMAVDSPSTTSSTRYELYFKCVDGTLDCSPDANNDVIVAMEIGA